MVVHKLCLEEMDRNNPSQVLVEANLVNGKNGEDLLNIRIVMQSDPYQISFYAPRNLNFGMNSTTYISYNQGPPTAVFNHLKLENVDNKTIKIEYEKMELFKIKYSSKNKTMTLVPPSDSPSLKIH